MPSVHNNKDRLKKNRSNAIYVNKRNEKKVEMVNYDTTSLCKRSFFNYVTRRGKYVLSGFEIVNGM